eukprot:295981-Pleurochrysis_carterae.AAC.1
MGARWWAGGGGAPSPSSRRSVPNVGPSPPGSTRGRGRAAPCPAPRCGPAASSRAHPAGGSGAPLRTTGPRLSGARSSAPVRGPTTPAGWPAPLRAPAAPYRSPRPTLSASSGSPPSGGPS